MSAPRLEALGISKRYPGVQALENVDLRVSPGEVLGLVGENGAGKSTLMKILAGVEELDAGVVRIDGRQVVLGSVAEALAHGVALIHQELNLADNLDVAANVMLGREPVRMGLMDLSALRATARLHLEAVGLEVDPDVPLASLSIGQQQLVEIAKALSVDAQLLIMDEPTSSLTPSETLRLFEVVETLRGKGVSVIYISHRLPEIESLADRVLVLRDGRCVGELEQGDISREEMVRLMVGRDLDLRHEDGARVPGDVVLEVTNLVTSAHPSHAVSLQLRSGEILGIAGLVGAGRSELLETLFGLQSRIAGTVRVCGRELSQRGPRAAIEAGLALVPEDRKNQGLVLEMSVADNIGLASVQQRARRGWIDRAAEERLASELIEELGVRTPSAGQPVGLLSGGNQQKIVLCKWLALEPRVLILDEPTRGVDVGSKQEIYRMLTGLAEAGMSVLFASSEMEELLELSDRVVVMHEGRSAGELTREELTEQAVMHLATGGTEFLEARS